MSTHEYQSKLAKVCKDNPQAWLLKWLQPSIYEIELSFNQIKAVRYQKDGSTQRQQVTSNFSNHRMVVADFELGDKAVTELFTKFPKTFLDVMYVSNFIIIDVTEELAGGLTMVEHKMLYELFCLGGRNAKVNVHNPIILYQGHKLDFVSM